MYAFLLAFAFPSTPSTAKTKLLVLCLGAARVSRHLPTPAHSLVHTHGECAVLALPIVEGARNLVLTQGTQIIILCERGFARTNID